MANFKIMRNGLNTEIVGDPHIGQSSEDVTVTVTDDGTYSGYTKKLYYSYCYHNEVHRALCAVNSNNEYIIPVQAFFEPGMVKLSVELSNGTNCPACNACFLIVTDGAKDVDTSVLPSEKTWQSYIQSYIKSDVYALESRIDNANSRIDDAQNGIKTANSRIDNLIVSSGSDSSAEVIDARTGYDGKAYDTLGTAIRAQVNGINEDLGKLDELTVTDTILLSSDNMERGSINKDTGVEETSDNVLRSLEYFDISAVTEIQFKGETSSEYYVRLVFYDADKKYVSGANGILANSGTIKLPIIQGAKYVRVVIAYISLSDLKYVKPVIIINKYVNAEYITRTLEETKEKIADKTIKSKINTVSFDSSNVTNGTISKDTGIESQSTTSCISDYINLGLTPVNIIVTGKTANIFYVRPVFYDADKTFISSPGGLDVHENPQSFDIPASARYMKMVFALNATDVGNVKPHVDIYATIHKTGEYNNDWTIKYRKWVDIPYGELLKYTDSRNACTNGFLRARKGDTITLQAPISFSLLLFSDTNSSKCYYNSYKDGVFYSTYTFKTDCYFMLNFTNHEDKTATLSDGDIVFTENTIPSVVTIVYDKERYDTVFVASAWSSIDEKRVADYVCDGVNDGEELQQAIYDLRARGGGVLKLSNERYIIDTLFDSGIPSVGKYGIYIPTNNYNVSLIKIEGVNFPNVIQPMYFGHCARLDMSQELYDSLDENEIVSMIGVKPVISGSGKVSRSSVGCTLSIENVAINIPAPQKKIIGVNCEYAYNMQLKCVHCGLTEYAGDPQEPNGKIINSNIDCIGIRTLYGYNWGSGYHIDDCNVRGWGLGFDISGEHLIMQNACARFVNTGYRFGHFGDDTMMSHPNTLINCCEEWLLHGMAFEGNGMQQSLNIIDFNIEDMTSNGWGRKTYATESNPGSYHGTLTYTTTKDSYKNAPHKFWEDGSGINVLTRDLNDKFSGTTANRPKYPQNNQQYFDTTLNKMLYYIGGNWIDAIGTVVN